MSTGIRMTIEERVRLNRGLRVIGTALAIMWFIHLITFAFDIHLGHWGVFPRSLRGLKGIIASPFLHGDWMHLISNTFPLLALGTGLYYFFPRVADRVLLSVYLFSGFFLWVFGRSYNDFGQFIFHIGASGVVYGLVMFMLGTGLFRRNTKSTVLGTHCTFFLQWYIPRLPSGRGGKLGWTPCGSCGWFSDGLLFPGRIGSR